MKSHALIVIACLAAFPVLSGNTSRELWYTKPANRWNEALPIGNGQMGAMVFGGTTSSRIQFNEYRVWTGKPHSYAHTGASEVLPEIRDLLFKGKQREAEVLASRRFMSQPLHQKKYQPCGDLLIDFKGLGTISDYRRALDIRRGIHTFSFKSGDVTIEQRSLAPYTAPGLLLHQIRADRPAALSCSLRMTSPHRGSETTLSGNGNILLRGRVDRNGIAFCIYAVCSATGRNVRWGKSGNCITVDQADSIEIRWTAATEVKSWNALGADPEALCRKNIREESRRDFDTLLSDHAKRFTALFDRTSVDFPRSARSSLPTDLRLAQEPANPDPDFAALLFQYGRYLLISCSRPGGEPATLQGIWNERLNPPWDSKYTCNINTEMNYWPAENTALPECHEALFKALGELAVSGRKTAKEHYGAGGWVLHHNFDLWRGTAPINASNHGIWVSGSGWLSLHLWEHYLFSLDREFLKEKAWPILRESARFYSDFLTVDPRSGKLVSTPSNSPEQGGLVAGPTMDHQIIRSLFRACIAASEIIGSQDPLVEKLKSQLPLIAPNRIGRHGQLQEWLEDVDNPGNRHRHVSHLWGVYPGSEITWKTPDLFKAARRSLVYRGDAATGWSMGWKINLWARFLDGDHAKVILSNLLRPQRGGNGGLYPNLFDACPPFQIDGNFGATAGIAEMLLQSHLTDRTGAPLIHVLPALPKEWKSGSFKGLRARGGFSVDAEWQEGGVLTVRVTAQAGGRCTVKIGPLEKVLSLKAGESKSLSVENWKRPDPGI